MDFGRERQVLDRGPAGDDAELRDVEVRVAAEVGAEQPWPGVVKAAQIVGLRAYRRSEPPE